MKLYRNAIILIVIVALLVGVYFAIDRLKPKGDLPGNTSDDIIRLTEYTTDQIESVKLENPDGTFVIVKEDTEWVLSAPTDLKYDSSILSSIVINAASIVADKLIEENAQDLGKYGLDNVITVTINAKDNKDTVLEIGDKTPTGSGYYVKLSGKSDVYTISSYTGNSLVTSRNGMRSKQMFDFTYEDIRSLSLDRKGENVFAAQTDSAGKEWSMVAPIKGTTNSTALTPMLDALVNSTFSSFVEDSPTDLAQYGLASPSYVFEFTTASHGSFRLSMGTEKVKGSEIYAQLGGSDEVFTMDISNFGFLDKPLKEIVGVFAYIVNIDQVEKIDLTMGGKTTNMTLDVYKDAEGKTDNDKDKFTVNGIDASGKNEEDDQPFRKFYQALIGISLDEIDVDGEPTGEAEITIEYTLKDGTMKVEYVSKDDNYYYVVRNGEYAGILVRKNKGEFGVRGMKEAYDEMIDFLAGS